MREKKTDRRKCSRCVSDFVVIIWHQLNRLRFSNWFDGAKRISMNFTFRSCCWLLVFFVSDFPFNSSIDGLRAVERNFEFFMLHTHCRQSVESAHRTGRRLINSLWFFHVFFPSTLLLLLLMRYFGPSFANEKPKPFHRFYSIEMVGNACVAGCICWNGWCVNRLHNRFDSMCVTICTWYTCITQQLHSYLALELHPLTSLVIQVHRIEPICSFVQVALSLGKKKPIRGMWFSWNRRHGNCETASSKTLTNKSNLKSKPLNNQQCQPQNQIKSHNNRNLKTNNKQ